MYSLCRKRGAITAELHSPVEQLVVVKRPQCFLVTLASIMSVSSAGYSLARMVWWFILALLLLHRKSAMNQNLVNGEEQFVLLYPLKKNLDEALSTAFRLPCANGRTRQPLGGWPPVSLHHLHPSLWPTVTEGSPPLYPQPCKLLQRQLWYGLLVWSWPSQNLTVLTLPLF